MSLRQTKFGISNLQDFAKIALAFLECNSMEELNRVKDEGNAITVSFSKIIKSNQHPLNSTLANISNFFVMMYRMKSHLLGKTLSGDEIVQTNKIMHELFDLMDKPEDKTSEYGAVIYMINSYVSLAECAVSCVLQDELLLSNEAMLIRANTFVCGCIYDQAQTATMANSPRTTTPFDYCEFNKGFYVVNTDTMPNSVHEKLIYALNRLIVESLLKMRYRVRTSYHALARANSILSQLNLCEFEQVRALLTADQALFTPSPEHLKTNQLQSYYVPTACALIGRIDSASKAEAMIAYIVKSHQLILKLLQIALIDRVRDKVKSSKLINLIKQMSNNTMIDLQLLCSVMNHYQRLSLSEKEIRILERDLLFIHTDISDMTKEIGGDYEDQAQCAYLVTHSGYHTDLKPDYLRLIASRKNKDDYISKVIAEITGLIQRHQSWQDKDGTLESKASFARMIKDYFYAAVRSAQSKTEQQRLHKALLYSFEIDKLKSKDGCDDIYELLILLSELKMSHGVESMEMYLRKISNAIQHLESASKCMSILNFARFITHATQVIQTILADENNNLGHLKQKASSYASTLAEFRSDLDEEVKAIVSAIESPKKKYTPAAAITSPQDTSVSLTDYLDLAVKVMRAENETELSLLSDQIAHQSAHPLILLDGEYTKSQLSYNRCLMHLHDMLEILLFLRRLTLLLPVSEKTQAKIKQKLKAMSLTATIHDDDMNPSRVLKLYFNTTIFLANITLMKNSIELAKLASDFIFATRKEANLLITDSWITTKNYPATLVNQVIDSCRLFFTELETDNSYGRFITAMKSCLVSALSAARTKAFKDCAQEKIVCAKGRSLQSSTRKYHQLFIAVNLFDNAIERLSGAQAAHIKQAEYALNRIKQLCENKHPSLPSLMSTAKMPTGVASAVLGGDEQTNVPLAVIAMIKMAGIYNRLYRSCLGANKSSMKAKLENVSFNTLLYNEYLSRQLAFLSLDINPDIHSTSRFPRELAIIQCLQIGIKAYHYGIEGEFPPDILIELMEFDCAKIKFDSYFTKDLCKITAIILAKRLDYYSSRLEEYKSKDIESLILSELNRLILMHKPTSGDTRKQAARLIMEYYLRFVFISARIGRTQQALSLHDNVFELCAEDELLPAYCFINYAYKKLAGIEAPLSKQDTQELYSQLSKISGSSIEIIHETLDGLSPTLYVYLSQLAQRVAKVLLTVERNFRQAEALGGLALQQFCNEQSSKQIIQEFMDNASAVNPVDHLPLTAELEAVYQDKLVTINDYLILGAEILDMQDAAQAAHTSEKLAQIPERPFIALEGKLAVHQESYNAATRKLHPMLVMLHIARRQHLKLTVLESDLANKQQIIDEFLNIPSKRIDEPLIIHHLNFLVLQAARAALYFGVAEHQINITGIECLVPLTKALRQVVSHETDLAEQQLISCHANYNVMMQKLASFMQAKIDLIHQSLVKRMGIAQQMLTKAMTDEQRARIPDYSAQLTLLNAVIAEFNPVAIPEVKAAQSEVVQAEPKQAEVVQEESNKPTETAPAPIALTPEESPKVCVADVEFVSVCQRCHDDDADKCFDAIYTLCHDILTSKKHSTTVRITAATTLSQSLLHQIDTALNIQKRHAAFKMLSTYHGFIMRHDKQTANRFALHLKEFEQHFDKLTMKDEPPKLATVTAVMEIETIEQDIEPANAAVVSANSSGLAEDIKLIDIEEQPIVCAPPIITETLDFSRLTTNLADLQFEAICKSCHDDDADICFNNIAKLCMDTLQSSRRPTQLRVIAALTLAQALMYRVNESSDLSKRESTLKALSGYQSFINKNAKKMGKQFVGLLNAYQNRVAQAPELAKTVATEENATSEIINETPAVTRPAVAAAATASIPKVIRILKRTAAVTQLETPVTAANSTQTAQDKPFKTKFYHAHKNIWINLETADLKSLLDYCYHDNAERHFRNIYQLIQPIIYNSHYALSLRVNLLKLLSQSLLERVSEVQDFTYHSKAANMIESHNSFANRGFKAEYGECIDYLNKYNRIQSVKDNALSKSQERSDSAKTQTDTPITHDPKIHTNNVEQQANPSIPSTTTSTSFVKQRLVHPELEDNSLLGYGVPRTNRLLQLFQMQLSYLQNIILSAFTSINHNVFIYGNSVLSSLYQTAPGHLQFACRLPKDDVFTLLTHEKNHQLLCLKEIIECQDKSGFLIRLDESKLQSAKLPYCRTDLLIEIKCLTGINDKAALEQFCHQQRLTSTMFYLYNNGCLIDVANHARCTAVYPVMRMDQRQNTMGELDLKLINQSLPPSNRDHREVILDALLQLSTYHQYLGCGMALKYFITLYKHELSDIKKQTMPIEWFDELFLNDNAMNTHTWLHNFDMLYDLFPQLHTDYADDFKIACQELVKATSMKNYRSMTHDEILSLRANFLLNAFYRSFKDTIAVIDFLQESGLDAFMETFCKFANGLVFEWMPIDLLEVTTQRFWNLLLQDAIPAIYHEYFRCHSDMTYDATDKDKFIHDLMASLTEDGYPDRLWLAEHAWHYHEQSISYPRLCM